MSTLSPYHDAVQIAARRVITLGDELRQMQQAFDELATPTDEQYTELRAKEQEVATANAQLQSANRELAAAEEEQDRLLFGPNFDWQHDA